MTGRHDSLASQLNNCWQASVLDAGVVSPSHSTPAHTIAICSVAIPSALFTDLPIRGKPHASQEMADQRLSTHSTVDHEFIGRLLTNIGTEYGPSAIQAPLFAHKRRSAMSPYRKALLFRHHH